MAIQKKPGTLLRVTKPVTEVWVNYHSYKAVYYEAPIDGSSSAIEIVITDTPSALGALSVERAE